MHRHFSSSEESPGRSRGYDLVVTWHRPPVLAPCRDRCRRPGPVAAAAIWSATGDPALMPWALLGLLLIGIMGFGLA